MDICICVCIYIQRPRRIPQLAGILKGHLLSCLPLATLFAACGVWSSMSKKMSSKVFTTHWADLSVAACATRDVVCCVWSME